MQTFLPYSSFKQSANVLDNKRLGKQRVECLQILRALLEPNYGWKNHPAVLMWRGHEGLLVKYSLSICEEWVSRGFKDTCADKIKNYCGPAIDPWWIGNHSFHISHQSNLIRKMPNHYAKFFPGIPDDLEYWWPTKQTRSTGNNIETTNII